MYRSGIDAVERGVQVHSWREVRLIGPGQPAAAGCISISVLRAGAGAGAVAGAVGAVALRQARVARSLQHSQVCTFQLLRTIR